VSAVDVAGEPQIGGLPASRFVGRRVKAMLSDSIFATVVCQGFFKKSIVVDSVVQGRRRQHHVSPKHVKPNWVENEDLQQEAIALGVRFTGEVNVGRAMEVAKQAATAKAQPVCEPPPVVPVTVVEEPPVVEVPEPAVEAPAVEEVEPPAKADYLAEITGVQASITADPSWVAEFADLQSLITSGREVRNRMAALRAEIAELEQRETEDTDLIELYIDSLNRKGVVVQRGKQDQPPQVASGSSNPEVSDESLMSNWFRTSNPQRFTYEQALTALGCPDNAFNRRAVRLAAERSGYTVIPSGRGRKLEFVKEVAGG
jgi:hypothetical protein